MRVLALVGTAAVALCVCALAAGSLFGDEAKEGAKVGDKAPVFEAKDDHGKEWKSADHVGKRVLVVYFYPGDLTGGCTKQACGFRDDMHKLADKGVHVIGVSGDSVKNHQLFKKVHKLNFTLLADEDGEIAKKFGVPFSQGGKAKAKDAEGNDVDLTRGVTIQRWTFIIGKDGNIVYKDSHVSAANDSKKILEVIEKEGK
ncbi:MAG TPA: peroxiredoxin [Gemmataceae bacterium]|jgi:peroxiredoxin Q/BCP|nr:peroxiredoxin [Gemmataceae bacterium]